MLIPPRHISPNTTPVFIVIFEHHMSLNKLVKFLEAPRPTVSGHRIRVPVILSDSKGTRLQKVKTEHAVERQIEFWCKKGATIQKQLKWLRENLDRKINFLGDIHLYVWLGTCNLTSIDKTRKISLTSWNEDTIKNILQGFNAIIDLLKQYKHSRVTFLPLPVYSIAVYNKNYIDFKDHDAELVIQIEQLNQHINSINQSLHTSSPDFSCDLLKTSNYKVGNKRKVKSRKYHNFKTLYTDGLHSCDTLSRVWLRKLSNQMYRDCWQ